MISSEDSSGVLLTAEAIKRGIKVISWPEINPKISILELDDHQEELFLSRSNRLGAVSKMIFDNKMLTTAYLRRAKFPVPDDIITHNLDEAKTFLAEHGRVVVKPISNTGGTGITTDITTQAALKPAFKLAGNKSMVANPEKNVVCQQYVEGNDYRVLVVNYQHLFSINRVPAYVEGDGQQTVQELVVSWNAQRKPECAIRLDETAHRLLDQKNIHLTDVLEKGQRITLAGVANYHSGGRLIDVTNSISEVVRQMAQEIAVYTKAPIVGIDFISSDINVVPGYIIELNATPDLSIHHFPDEGEARDVAKVVIDMLFPETVIHA